MTQRPLCFVLMPFGRKLAADGATINFDAVYEELIALAIAGAGLEPLRAEEEMTGGVIHKPMFERLILSGFAVVDLTTANTHVFYEPGVRHAVRPWSTVLLCAEGGRQLLIPVISYAVERRIAPGQPDYSDYATRLELAVLANDREQASQALERALALVREP